MLSVATTAQALLARCQFPARWRYPGGKVFWVDWNSTAACDFRGFGTFDAPFKTATYAFSRCLSSRGDTIICKPQHYEALTTDPDWNKSGVTLIGLTERSQGATAVPYIDMTGHSLTISAMGVRICNLRFTNADTNQRVITITGTGVVMLNCQFVTASVVCYAPRIVATGVDFTLVGCRWDNASGAALNGLAVSGHQSWIEKCSWHGAWSKAIDVSATIYDLVIKDCVGVDDVAGNRVFADTAGATGIVTGCRFHGLNASVDAMFTPGTAMGCFENYGTNDDTKSGKLSPVSV